MEKIKINSIEMKGPNKTICVVKFTPAAGPMSNIEATLNTKWQSQEVNYLEKDVGIGGEVSVEITQKGQYTNITKVDFDSAVPHVQILKEVQNGERSLNGQEQKPLDDMLKAKGLYNASDYNESNKPIPANVVTIQPIRVDGTYCGNYSKDKSIIAQCLVKAMLGQCRTEYNIQDAVDMYKEALELLG